MIKENDLDENTFIIKYKKETDYTTIFNECLNDEAVAADALGVLVYLMSKPDDWSVIVNNLCNRFKFGRDKARRIINDLQKSGYMRRVRRRRKDGSLSKVVIYVSDTPIFLKVNPVNTPPESSNLSNKEPQTGFQAVVENPPQTGLPAPAFQAVVPYIQNKDLTKNNNNNLSTAGARAPTEDYSSNAVVVFLLDKIRNLPNFDISKEQMDGWVVRYGKDYVEEKIKLMASKEKIVSQGGYLNSALMYNWKENTQTQQKSSHQAPVRQETAVKTTQVLDENWFKSLPVAEKKKIYEGACLAYPLLADILNQAKLCALENGFESTCWFKPMISAYRSYYRL